MLIRMVMDVLEYERESIDEYSIRLALSFFLKNMIYIKDTPEIIEN